MSTKERPILFSGPLVRAILGGTKTQTRRLVNLRGAKPDAGRFEQSTVLPALWLGCDVDDTTIVLRCPYGAPGDCLWVRETCILPVFDDDPEQVVYAADHADPEVARAEIQEGADGDVRWRPSIHMPRWASRIDLEVTRVRVERLQAITEEDARAEGVDWTSRQFLDPQDEVDDDREDPREVGYAPAGASFARDNFRRLWDRINGDRATWDSNPWVWAIDFKRVRP
jgi:hypothetical protein